MGTTARIKPLAAIAALTVAVSALTGIGAMTGLSPISASQAAEIRSVNPAEAPPTMARSEAPLMLAQTAPPPDYVPPPAGNTPPPGYAPPQRSGYGPPPGYVPPRGAEPPPPICHDCGVIESVREVEKKSNAVGAGTVVGGIVGGILGNQIGRGHGRDAMTVLGAVGGAVAGHEIEKNAKKGNAYEIVIRFEDGSTRMITQDTPPAWRKGDRVRLVDGVIKPW